mgnify:CR=1 FL=1
MSLLSMLLVVLAFVPVLFPFVVVIAALLALFMVFRLRTVMTDSNDPTGPGKRIESRILRRSMFAAALSLVLYIGFWLYTQFFYILPLKQDQEPFRDDARKVMEQTE